MTSALIPPAMTSALRILVADDEPAMLSLNANFLRQKGFDVTEASDGETAWALAGMGGFDLLLLDVMMPGMSGWEVCKRVKQTPATKDTAVVMLTGMGETLNDMNSPLFSADSWLDKPFDFSELERKIRETLALYGKRSPADAARPPTYDDAAALSSPMFDEDYSDDEEDDDFDDQAETQRPPPKARPEPFSLKVSAPALPLVDVPKRSSSKKGASKKSTPSKAAKAPSVERATAPEKAAPKKAAAKAAPPKAAAKKAAPKKAAPKKPAAKKAAPKKATAKKAAPKKAATTKPARAKKAPPKKKAPAKAAAKKPAPKKKPASKKKK